MNNRNQLSPAGAYLMGLLFIFCGALPLFLGSRLAHAQHPGDAPAWLGVVVALMFVFAGLAIIVSYGVDRVDASGQLAPNTPMSVRIAQHLLVTMITGSMFAVFGWVAFGPGERHFSSTLSLPIGFRRAHSSDLSGRVVFGIATVMIGLFFVYAVVAGARQLRASRGEALASSE